MRDDLNEEKLFENLHRVFETLDRVKEKYIFLMKDEPDLNTENLPLFLAYLLTSLLAVYKIKIKDFLPVLKYLEKNMRDKTDDELYEKLN